MSQEQLFAAALALPPESRIELAGKLYASVDESAAPPVDPQLLAELDRRMTAYERGDMKTYTHEEVVLQANAAESAGYSTTNHWKR